jgi:hypothetical protein
MTVRGQDELGAGAMSFEIEPIDLISREGCSAQGIFQSP